MRRAAERQRGDHERSTSLKAVTDFKAGTNQRREQLTEALDRTTEQIAEEIIAAAAGKDRVRLGSGPRPG